MSDRLMTPARVEFATWLMILGGLAAGIGIETNWGRQLNLSMTLPAPPPAHYKSPALTAPFKLGAPDTFLETPLRPLFVITRRPAPKLPDIPTPRETMKKGQFVLVGTMIVNTMKYAHLIEKASGKTLVIAEGKTVQGLQVKEIGPARIVLSKEDETETLDLITAKSPVVVSSGKSAKPRNTPRNEAASKAIPPSAIPAAKAAQDTPPGAADKPSRPPASRIAGVQQRPAPRTTAPP